MAHAALKLPEPMLVALTTNLYQWPVMTFILPSVVSMGVTSPVRYCSRRDQEVALLGMVRKLSKATPELLFRPLGLAFIKPSWTLFPLDWPLALTSTDTVIV